MSKGIFELTSMKYKTKAHGCKIIICVFKMAHGEETEIIIVSHGERTCEFQQTSQSGRRRIRADERPENKERPRLTSEGAEGELHNLYKQMCNFTARGPWHTVNKEKEKPHK